MIGERLYDLRKEKGLTQQELAQKLDLTKYTISSYETDRSTPNDEIKLVIARFFDVSLDYLLGLIDQPLSYRRNERIVMVPEFFPVTAKKEVETYVAFLEHKLRSEEKPQQHNR